MKAKPIFKTIWISLLSTLTLVLAQTLKPRGFEGFNKITLFFVKVPLEYFLINFLIFLMLTIFFTFVRDLFPVDKLYKGIVYASMISIIWVVLKFQPSTYINILDKILDSVVFLVPMFIYGIFLGYLADEKTVSFKIEKKHAFYFIISFVWILFHIIYVFLSGIAKGQFISYIIWMFIISLILGIVFGFGHEMSIEKKKNSFYLSMAFVILMFGSYYLYQFTINNIIDVELFIKIALDVVSIVLALQVLELLFSRFSEEKWK